MFERTTSAVPARGSVFVPIVLLGWLAASVGVAVSGVLPRVPILAAVWLGGSVAGGVVAYRRSPALRGILDALDVRAVIAIHVLRAPIGALFLYEHAQGRLGALFAYRAGIGDIAVGVLALAAMAFSKRRGLVRAWCVIGVLDLLVAVGTAQLLVLVRQDPLMLAAFARLPYSLLPTLIVPAMIATHFLVLARIRR